MSDKVAIARVIKPKGLRGEVFAESLTDFPERFEDLKKGFLKADQSAVDKPVEVEKAVFINGRLVIKLAGIDSRDSAESIRGAWLMVAEEDAFGLGEGEYYEWQLIGCEVSTQEGALLGKVNGIIKTGGTDVLTVKNGNREYLIPFASAICQEVDTRTKKIIVTPPDGLLDL
jgi:16S rRNA processing protein RimM